MCEGRSEGINEDVFGVLWSSPCPRTYLADAERSGKPNKSKDFETNQRCRAIRRIVKQDDEQTT